MMTIKQLLESIDERLTESRGGNVNISSYELKMLIESGNTFLTNEGYSYKGTILTTSNVLLS